MDLEDKLGIWFIYPVGICEPLIQSLGTAADLPSLTTGHRRSR
jgi:hypothetical protein